MQIVQLKCSFFFFFFGLLGVLFWLNSPKFMFHCGNCCRKSDVANLKIMNIILCNLVIFMNNNSLVGSVSRRTVIRNYLRTLNQIWQWWFTKKKKRYGNDEVALTPHSIIFDLFVLYNNFLYLYIKENVSNFNKVSNNGKMQGNFIRICDHRSFK